MSSVSNIAEVPEDRYPARYCDLEELLRPVTAPSPNRKIVWRGSKENWNYSDKFDNVANELEGGDLEERPTSQIKNAKRMDGLGASAPISISDPISFAMSFGEFVNERGSLPKTPSEITVLAEEFAKLHLTEEFQVLQAVQTLREQFHLSPKPSMKWGERKTKGKSVKVGDVLGEYAPDLSFRDKLLGDLTPQEWWDAFYKDDAVAGHISDSLIRETDGGLRSALKRFLGIGTLASLIAPAPIERREQAITDILCTADTKAALAFVHTATTPKSGKGAGHEIST